MNALQPDTLIDAVILLSKCKDDKVTELINQLLDIYQDITKRHPEIDTPTNRCIIELINKLKKLSKSPSSKVEKNSLLLQFLNDPNLKQDNIVYNQIKELFESIVNTELDPEKIDEIKKKLENSILISKCARLVSIMSGKLSGCMTTTDSDRQEMYLNDTINMARQIIELSQSTDRLASGAIERIDFRSKKSLKKSLELYKEREVAYKLQTGLRGLNIMLGRRKAFALGECVAFIALNHNFKSGMLMTVARGLVKYNNPQMLPNKGKPLILFISLENEANRNLMWFYQYAYEQTFRKSSEGLSDDEIIDFLQSFYNENGFTFIIERRDGGKFGYDEYVALIESYEAQGYWVVASLVDYANKMKKTSVSTGNASSKGNHNLIGDLFASLCTYHKTKGILFITAHQLNRQAQDLVAVGRRNAVQCFGPQYIADSIDVSRELDLEVYMLIEKNQYGQKFLTCQRGKHRYVDDTPEADKYFAYPFTEFGIEDDINTDPKFVRNIYSVPAPAGYKEQEEELVGDKDNNIF